MSDSKLLVIVGVVTALIVGAGLYYFSRGAQVTPDMLIPASGVVHDSGSEQPVVTIVEFGDFQCPACGAFHPTMKRIAQEYAGSVRYVHRHFPLTSIHGNALQAAEASEAAGAQNKFWEMHDLLYTKQSDLTMTALISYANELKLDVAQFSKDLNEHTYLDIVNRDLNDGKAAGVNGTPSLFINGTYYKGQRDYDTLSAFLDSLGASKDLQVAT